MKRQSILLVVAALLALAGCSPQARQSSSALLPDTGGQQAEAQVCLNQLLGAPGVELDALAFRRAVQQGETYAWSIQATLKEAMDDVDGDTREYTRIAATEADSTVDLTALILSGSEVDALAYYEQLKIRGSTTVAAINLALDSLGAGPSSPGVRHF